ncbi:hypothetical protein LX16_1072 [Stackebrandtia albiflava]|uniref:AsnC-like helix-turn-helix protein n=1 Tax=Stackebrandtia albiflava TaxID=406432 RepID=A0A562VBW6_9ACTN|nr:hypothetical protein [Stackebrandtia albiflava]TWJ15369.1 hypothetical protein LX16_1072 [Stackebrandtia albiflava]
MRLVVAIVEFSPHEGIRSTDLEETFRVSASTGDRLEHIHATRTTTTWYICIYSLVQDPVAVRAAADQLVRRSLASIQTIDRWSVRSVVLLM